jgi:AraC family transcriptional regulator
MYLGTTMHTSASRGNYAGRLDRVVTWLTDHLDEALDLARLADVACLSPYHFHRIYRAMQGETVAATVRRLRLHRAAVELIDGSLPVHRIARRAGYRSQAAFTRAFRAAYDTPPARYRSALVSSPDKPTFQVMIRETRALRLAALEHVGSYGNIGSTFGRLLTMAASQGLPGPETRYFGVYYSDPVDTPKAMQRAHAGLTLPAGRVPKGELQPLELREGRYAVVLHVGPFAELGRAYGWLYGEWLAESGEEPADAPCLEVYLNDPRIVRPAGLRTEVWLPLRE